MIINFLKKFSKDSISTKIIQENDIQNLSQYNRIKFYSQIYCKELLLMNDNPDIEREIIHFLIFKRKKDLENFLDDVEKKMFRKIANFYNSKCRYPYILEVVRTDKTEFESVKNFTLQIIQLSIKYNGIYETWETTLVPNI